MSNVIDSIQLSGVTYTIQGSGGGGIPESAFTAYTASTDSRIAEDEEVTAAGLNALNAAISGISGNNVVELTQAQYDALVTGGTVDPSAFYISTDATAGDLTQYWTSAQTQSAITSAVSGKVDTSTFNTYSGSVDTALSGKQDTLVSGTNIKTINNESILGSGNIDIQGGGGGKAVSGGTNISITTGETADTINCTLPYYINSGNCWTIFGYSGSHSNISTNAQDSVYIGFNNVIKNTNTSATRKTNKNILIGWNNMLESYYNSVGLGFNVIIGRENILSGNNNIRESYVIGSYNTGHTSFEFICGWSNKTKNIYETSFGRYNNSVSGSSTYGDSGNTLFSVGNGTPDARHNAFEIRQNGDIYITSGGTDIKLQDHLGGGGGSITIDPTLDSGSTNAVANSAITNAINAKQDTLSAGTGISIVDNVISATGGGGGTTYSAGRGIDITNDTISFSLPISAGTDTSGIQEGSGTKAIGYSSHAEGFNASAIGNSSHAEGQGTSAFTDYSHAEGGEYTSTYGKYAHAEGRHTTASGYCSHTEGQSTVTISGASNSHAEGFRTTAFTSGAHTEGYYTYTSNICEHASGQYNNSVSASTTFGDSGNTLFSVGNGTADNARHNAFEIRQNGDIYLSSGGTDIKLQDHLGGGGSITIDPTLDSGSTNAVANSAITAQFNTLNARITEDEEVTAAGLNSLNDKFGGLKLVKLTQSEYNALSPNYDSNTLYVIVN